MPFSHDIQSPPRPTALPLTARLRARQTPSTDRVTIAMVDSDFISHPDLISPKNRILRYVDAVNQSEQDMPPPAAEARHWHGTMTACTAAGNGALSHGFYRSLAPDANLVLIRTMNDDDRVPTASIVWALDWIARNAETYGIRIVNISVYADEIDQTLAHPVNMAVERLVEVGIIVVAAAGNNPLSPIRPPAAAPGAITVGGLNDNNTVTDDDNTMYHSAFGITDLGVQKPEIIAPAVLLAGPLMPDSMQRQRSGVLFALDALDDGELCAFAGELSRLAELPGEHWDSRDVSALRTSIDAAIAADQLISPWYKLVDGTSFAAPIVCSIVAQMLACNPLLTPHEVKAILTTTARPLPGVAAARQGAGIVDQPRAIERALGESG